MDPPRQADRPRLRVRARGRAGRHHAGQRVRGPRAAALIIGLAAGLVCYWAVAAKSILGYDDSLDAFGVHGVGGFLGAILTGALVSLPLWVYGSEMRADQFPGKLMDVDGDEGVRHGRPDQVAAHRRLHLGRVRLRGHEHPGAGDRQDDRLHASTRRTRSTGLDLAEHGEVGFDYGGAALDELPSPSAYPKSASAPPNGASGVKRFSIVVDGTEPKTLVKAWSALCQVGAAPPSPEFKTLYPYVTTVSGNKFRFRGGDPVVLRQALERLLQNSLNGTPVKTHVET